LFDQLELEHGNLRVALDWCEAEPDGIESAARIVDALGWFWVLRSHVLEARARVERLVATDSGSPFARATLYCVAGYLAYFRGAHAEAIRWLEPSLALWREQGDRRGLASAQLYLAQSVWLMSGDLTRAKTLLEESANLVRRAGAGTPHNTVLATYVDSPIQSLARLAEQQGDLGRARELIDEALARCKASGDSHGFANGLRSLALLSCKQDDADRATTLFKEALRLYHGLADVPCSWNSFILLAYAATLQGCYARAARLLGAADIQQSTSGMIPLMFVRAVHDDTITAARSGLGDDAFAAAWAEGRGMTLNQAVADALERPNLT
jgi:tetratricopeptide (TPR) repeat protein